MQRWADFLDELAKVALLKDGIIQDVEDKAGAGHRAAVASAPHGLNQKLYFTPTVKTFGLAPKSLSLP